jgi:glycine/D-amino acid oxidase-like deaminating enzyme
MMLPSVQAEVVAQQACYLPAVPDGLPVIGAVPGFPGAYVATGHTCWGILNGPATGLVVLELIADGRTASIDLRPLSPQRFAVTSQAGPAAGLRKHTHDRSQAV